MWCDSDKITHQFVLNTWWKQDGVFSGNRKNHFEAESCQRTVSMALQLSSTCIALSLLFRLKSKIIVKGKHHREPSTYQKRLLKVYEYGYSTRIVQKSWSFYSNRESMDELIVNSEEQKVQDCLSSTNFYLNISTASVMNEKVCQINQ